MKRFWGILQLSVGYAAMAVLIAALGWFILQVFGRQDVLNEMTPDPGMIKHCTQQSDNTLMCSQAPAAPNAPPAKPDPNAPLFVTVGPAE